MCFFLHHHLERGAHTGFTRWCDPQWENTDTSYVIASAEADTYERTRCISGEIWEKDFLKVADYEIPPIQAVGSDEEF